MYHNFKMQKCLHLEQALSLKIPKIYGDYILSEKYEGWYCTIYFDGEQFHAPRSSNNRVIPSLMWVVDMLNNKKLLQYKPFTIIAEAYLEDTPFEILNGIFNRSKGDCACYKAIFKVHDIVPLDIATTAAARLLLTIQILKKLGQPFLHYVTPLYIGIYQLDIWNKYRDEVINRGGEGIVGKRAASFYQQGKRNADLLKDKLNCTVDCLAVALEEGVGEKGNLSLTLISERANGMQVRTVISRHSDQQLFRSDSSYIVGKVVEIGGMSEYADGQIRQPVFKHIRHDKSLQDIT
jgi:hypothetical protein